MAGGCGELGDLFNFPNFDNTMVNRFKIRINQSTLSVPSANELDKLPTYCQ